MTLALPPHTPPTRRECPPEGEASATGGVETEPTLLPALIRNARTKRATPNRGGQPLLPRARVPPTQQLLHKTKKTKRPANTTSLSPMDERVLILYHSALRQTWATATAHHQLQPPPPTRYPHEAAFAVTQIQRVLRGHATRTQLAAFDSPKRQRAARTLQLALRWHMVNKRVTQRVHHARAAMATRLQRWYHGCRCRESLQDAHARVVVQRVVLLQRHFRGHRFWRVVAELLHARRCRTATVIQRVFRGWRGRQLAASVRFEQQRFVRNFQASTTAHARRTRCVRCDPTTCTEASLFDCFMARFVGLLDFHSARVLCVEGLRRFPSSGRFCFFYAVLLQVLGEAVGVAMQLLHRAVRVLGVSDDALTAVRWFLVCVVAASLASALM